eukprot:2935779-Rhodomonas_salina.1
MLPISGTETVYAPYLPPRTEIAQVARMPLRLLPSSQPFHSLSLPPSLPPSPTTRSPRPFCFRVLTHPTPSRSHACRSQPSSKPSPAVAGILSSSLPTAPSEATAALVRVSLTASPPLASCSSVCCYSGSRSLVFVGVACSFVVPGTRYWIRALCGPGHVLCVRYWSRAISSSSSSSSSSRWAALTRTAAVYQADCDSAAGITLRACYDVSGTNLACYGSIGLRACYAMPGTETAYNAICLRACYAMCGTVLRQSMVLSAYAFATQHPVLRQRMELSASAFAMRCAVLMGLSAYAFATRCATREDCASSRAWRPAAYAPDLPTRTGIPYHDGTMQSLVLTQCVSA